MSECIFISTFFAKSTWGGGGKNMFCKDIFYPAYARIGSYPVVLGDDLTLIHVQETCSAWRAVAERRQVKGPSSIFRCTLVTAPSLARRLYQLFI